MIITEGRGVASVSRRRVLLLDSDPIKRKLRLSSMAQKGIDVCLATDAAEARLLVRESLYDLVLIDLPRDREGAVRLGQALRQERVEQPVWFFVGRPDYLGAAPPQERPRAAGTPSAKHDLNASIERSCDRTPGRGRLLEAVWRMCVLRRKKNGTAATSPADGDANKDSFGQAVRLLEGALDA